MLDLKAIIFTFTTMSKLIQFAFSWVEIMNQLLFPAYISKAEVKNIKAADLYLCFSTIQITL